MNNDGCKFCGVDKAIKIIGGKWTILLLHNLFEGEKRFGQLQKSLEGVSPKTLSIRLKELEKQGIIKRQVFAEIPLHVEYSLTKKGQSLKEIFNQMDQWGANFN